MEGRVPHEGAIIYAVNQDGKLLWYKHRGYRDGTMSWAGPKEIGRGWGNFTQLVTFLPGTPSAVS